MRSALVAAAILIPTALSAQWLNYPTGGGDHWLQRPGLGTQRHPDNRDDTRRSLQAVTELLESVCENNDNILRHMVGPQ